MLVVPPSGRCESRDLVRGPRVSYSTWASACLTTCMVVVVRVVMKMVILVINTTTYISNKRVVVVVVNYGHFAHTSVRPQVELVRPHSRISSPTSIIECRNHAVKTLLKPKRNIQWIKCIKNDNVVNLKVKQILMRFHIKKHVTKNIGPTNKAKYSESLYEMHVTETYWLTGPLKCEQALRGCGVDLSPLIYSFQRMNSLFCSSL